MTCQDRFLIFDVCGGLWMTSGTPLPAREPICRGFRCWGDWHPHWRSDRHKITQQTTCRDCPWTCDLWIQNKDIRTTKIARKWNEPLSFRHCHYKQIPKGLEAASLHSMATLRNSSQGTQERNISSHNDKPLDKWFFMVSRSKYCVFFCSSGGGTADSTPGKESLKMNSGEMKFYVTQSGLIETWAKSGWRLVLRVYSCLFGVLHEQETNKPMIC